MPASLHYLPPFEHINTISMLDRAQSVGYCDHTLSLAPFLQRLLDKMLRFCELCL